MSEFYKTQNLYEASFLLTKGYKLAGKEKEDRKVTLLFKEDNNKKTQEAAMEFYNNGKIEAKKCFDSYRTLKDFVFEG